MTDAPIDREAIRRTARARAHRMGLAVVPEPKAERTPEEILPTMQPGVLRGLLYTGRLTTEQDKAARQVLAEVARAARENNTDTPEDAA